MVSVRWKAGKWVAGEVAALCKQREGEARERGGRPTVLGQESGPVLTIWSSNVDCWQMLINKQLLANLPTY